MPDVAFDLRFLKYAMLVAEHGSFRRAADVLNLPQSTVSRRIQLLENRLGVALFERDRNGARLTFAGQRFLRDAAFGADQLRQAIADLNQVRRGDQGELRIGLVASLGKGFLADMLCSFHAKYPGVEVIIEESSSQLNAAGVLSGRLDVAFISGTPSMPGCDTRQLWEERIHLALPSSHALAGCEVLGWKDVQSEKFIVSADGPGREIEDYLIKKLSHLGFRPRIIVQKVGRENLMNMVARGFGLTLTTYSTLGTHFAGVAFIPIGEGAESVQWSAVWPTHGRNLALPKLLQVCDALSNRYEGKLAT